MSGIPKFTISCDRTSGEFLPTTIHAVLSAPDPEGGEDLVPMEIVSIGVTPDNIVTIQAMGAEEEGSLVQVFEVTVLEAALQRASFVDDVARPLDVVFRARPLLAPGSNHEAPVVEQKAQIVVEAATTIHWYDEQDDDSVDGTLSLDADGASVLHLRLWCERFDAVERRIVTDDTVVFTHWTDQGAKAAGFVACNDDLPMLDPTSRRDRTRWCTTTALPSDTLPNAEPPIDTGIRVKAWKAGTISRRHGGIDNPTNTPPLVIAHVPVTLEAATATAELLEPVRPVPANTLSVPLRVRIVNERTRRPVESGIYQLELDATTGCGSRLVLANGDFASTAAVALKPENEGVVGLDFVPPELSYEPGSVYAETLRITRGSGAEATDVATLQLFLAPRLEATITAEKPGLEFESRELNFAAGSVPHAFTGTLSFEIANANPEETTTADVANAKIEITCGTAARPVGYVQTDKDGSFRWELSELKPGLVASGLTLTEHDLDEEELPICDFDAFTEKVIDNYDGQMKKSAPLQLYDAGLRKEVLTHRLEFGSNLATYSPDDLKKIVAGTELYRTGITYGSIYDGMCQDMTKSVVDQLGGIYQELTALAVTFFDVGQKLAKAGGGLLKWLESVGAGVAKRFFRFASTTMADGLQRGAQSILAWVRNAAGRTITPALKRAITHLESAWATIVGTISNLRASFANASGSTGLAAKSKHALGALATLVVGLLKVIADILKLLAQTLWATVVFALQLAGKAVAGAADWMGKRLSSMGIPDVDRFGAWVRQNYGKYFAADTFKDWGGLVKIVELQFLSLLDSIGVFPATGAGTGAGIGPRLVSFDRTARAAVGFLDSDIARVRLLPSDAKPGIRQFRDTATVMAESVRARTVMAAELEADLAGVDTVLLSIEVFFSGVVFYLSGPAGLPAYFAACKKAELAVGALKLFVVRLPHIAYTFFQNLYVGSMYGLSASHLARPVAATP